MSSFTHSWLHYRHIRFRRKLLCQNQGTIKHPKDLLPLIDTKSVYTERVIDEINIGMRSQKRKDYIVLAMLPGFPEFRIIDGNHRLIEKASELDFVFDCLILADRRVIDYLEPNSKRFIETIYYINSVALF